MIIAIITGIIGSVIAFCGWFDFSHLGRRYQNIKN